MIALPVTSKCLLNLQSTLVDQNVEFFQSFFHSVSEFSQKVFKLKNSSEHVPVPPRFLLSLLEQSKPSLNFNSSLVSSVSVI